MKSLVVIAQNEAKAKEGEKLLEGFQVKKAYPGAKFFPRHFDAVIVFTHEAKEINFIKDILTRYSDAPIKAFFGKTDVAESSNYKAKSYVLGKKDEMIASLKSQYTELDALMKKVFKDFDLDGSGFIDSNELAEVAKSLGKTLDNAELDECLKDLDQNKDGKISYEEFAKWWLSGR
jgi:glutaredoxin 2